MEKLRKELLDIANELSVSKRSGKFFERSVNVKDLELPKRLYEGVMLAGHAATIMAAELKTRDSNKNQLRERFPIHLLCNILSSNYNGDGSDLIMNLILLKNYPTKANARKLLNATYIYLMPYAVNDNWVLAYAIRALVNYLEELAKDIPFGEIDGECIDIDLKPSTPFEPLYTNGTMPINIKLPNEKVVERMCANAVIGTSSRIVAGGVYRSKHGCYLALEDSNYLEQDIQTAIVADTNSFLRLR